ncbi:hypothetical protein QTG54_014316 [Skeletonema marinoi]|uniref:Uncharacterized protein n=1 Tax=Skeletonema marinoi TaxID=267567 RepID=A0AAD8XVX5_9STRA|nr:hypothetical protein QTG54_014316 [Skeletonema marinoi]
MHFASSSSGNSSKSGKVQSLSSSLPLRSQQQEQQYPPPPMSSYLIHSPPDQLVKPSPMIGGNFGVRILLRRLLIIGEERGVEAADSSSCSNRSSNSVMRSSNSCNSRMYH